ncbi:uncharacterized protein O3C94_007295 [Discoglossus pictus]
MENLIQGHEVDGLRTENVRLVSENGELRKMVALMQENLELRYALRDHETQVRTLSPPSPSKDPGRCKESFAPSSTHHKGRSAGQNAERLGINAIGSHHGSHGEGGHSPLKDSPGKSSGSSSSHHNPPLSGHRKLIESLTKLNLQEKSKKEPQNGCHVQRVVASYR